MSCSIAQFLKILIVSIYTNRLDAERSGANFFTRLKKSPKKIFTRRIFVNVYAVAIKKLNLGFRVFLTLVACANAQGEINMPPSELSKYLGVSRQTIGNHLRNLVESNVLKYKYSGKGIINPEFYYIGAETDRPTVLSRYSTFKSDF